MIKRREFIAGSAVRLEEAQRVRRDHESAHASSGDQHGSNQNPRNFALGHRGYSPNPSLSIVSPSYFCCGRCHSMSAPYFGESGFCQPESVVCKRFEPATFHGVLNTLRKASHFAPIR
jgi:hypothetical protein